MKTIDWANLSFGYMPTDYNVRYNYRNGSWGELEISSSEYINMHMAATCLHYGQEAFETSTGIWEGARDCSWRNDGEWGLLYCARGGRAD